jgi:hypothetical protein
LPLRTELAMIFTVAPLTDWRAAEPPHALVRSRAKA